MDFDPAVLDALEQHMWADIWASAAPETAAAHAVDLHRFGPVQVTAVGDLPEAGWLNLVLGSTAPGAVEGGHLAAAVEWAESLGVEYYVPVTPGLPGSNDAEGWLRANGHELGYGWMKFVRDGSPPEFPEPDVEIAELSAGESEDFGTIVAEGFGMPAWAKSLFAGLPSHPRWHCYVALIDGLPVASAAMLAMNGIAEFGLAATLEPARGRGCQLALLRRRIVDAAAIGCHTLLVETGERLPARPSASYRNILRAGFREAYLRPNWQRAGA